MTPKDYSIISEELEYAIDHDTKYRIEDDFWKNESKDWDGTLDEFHSYVTRKNFRNTVIPENIKNIILRIKYWYDGKIYKVITNNINFIPGKSDNDTNIHFSIPLNNAWVVDHDDKPVKDITEKVKRYAGPRNDFHKERVPLTDFLYYTPEKLKNDYPSVVIKNVLNMKKKVSTLDGFTTDLRIP